jgi:hypothetical protein
MNWAFGITTIGNRYNTTLPITITSLRSAGFDNPILFIDDPGPYNWKIFNLECVYRSGRIKAFPNWFLAITELVLRFPLADRYALFQDDIITSRNLKLYLEKSEYPENGYWNLYTFPQNQELANGRKGWYESLQNGLSACGLVFSREVVLKFWKNTHLIERPRNAARGHKSIDGGVITALQQEGIKEFVHNPSLLQHIGTDSVIGNKKHPQSLSFMGEDFDLQKLLKKTWSQNYEKNRNYRL